eukprot:7406-Heterococcus_DN1.PRE.1
MHAQARLAHDSMKRELTQFISKRLTLDSGVHCTGSCLPSLAAAAAAAAVAAVPWHIAEAATSSSVMRSAAASSNSALRSASCRTTALHSTVTEAI